MYLRLFKSLMHLLKVINKIYNYILLAKLIEVEIYMSYKTSFFFALLRLEDQFSLECIAKNTV